MANTTFVDNSTIIVADWCNDVNDTVYDVLGDGINPPTSATQVRTNIGAPSLTGAGASGSWNIDILGNSATATSAATATTATNAGTVTTTVSSGATGTTQTAGDNSTKIATTAYADNAATQAASALVPVRQTVLSGPVDTSGLPSFGGSTGSATVTATGTLIATAANGTTNRVGSIVNPSWTGLTTTGTMYLYLDIAANGTCTTGSSTLAPTYRWGGADVVTNGQFTFNIQEMQGKVGNGSVATQTYRVFVGEVTVAGSVVTAITWYALMGRYDSGFTATLPSTGTAVSRNHNVGCVEVDARLILECTTAEFGYSIGDRVVANVTNSGANPVPIQLWTTRNTCGFTAGSTVAFYAVNKTTGGSNTMTAANWKYKLLTARSIAGVPW